ncbi:MAG TPA: hypothetical protein VGI75_13060 [Pirellulales bacterium]
MTNAIGLFRHVKTLLAGKMEKVGWLALYDGAGGTQESSLVVEPFVFWMVVGSLDGQCVTFVEPAGQIDLFAARATKRQ